MGVRIVDKSTSIPSDKLRFTGVVLNDEITLYFAINRLEDPVREELVLTLYKDDMSYQIECLFEPYLSLGTLPIASEYAVPINQLFDRSDSLNINAEIAAAAMLVLILSILEFEYNEDNGNIEITVQFPFENFTVDIPLNDLSGYLTLI